MRLWQVTHAHHNACCLHIINIGLCMEHLNKLNKSINSKRLPYSDEVVCIKRCCDAVRLRHNANYVIHEQMPGSISGPSTVICLHCKSYRAEPRRSRPSPRPLSVGQAHMPFEWAEHCQKRFTLPQTVLGTVPSPVKCYSVNGV